MRILPNVAAAIFAFIWSSATVFIWPDLNPWTFIYAWTGAVLSVTLVPAIVEAFTDG